MKIVTYENAKINKLKRFFTGRECKNGHVDEQLTSSRECVSCKREREARKYNQGLTGHKDYYKRNRTLLLEKQKIHDNTRRSAKMAYHKQWRKLHPEYNSKYVSNNLERYRFHAANRRAAKLRATPPWVEYDKIKQLYLLAGEISKQTGVPHEVDHIIPLQSPLVCGLHCFANLRIITETENRIKHNSLIHEE